MLIKKTEILIVIVLSLISTHVFAQDQSSAQSEQTQQNGAASVENESVETQENPSASNGAVIPEVFNPSEEIIEDTAVSFPVDI